MRIVEKERLIERGGDLSIESIAFNKYTPVKTTNKDPTVTIDVIFISFVSNQTSKPMINVNTSPKIIDAKGVVGVIKSNQLIVNIKTPHLSEYYYLYIC